MGASGWFTYEIFVDVPGAAPNAWPRLTETYSKISEIDVWNRRIDPNRQSNNARVRFGYVRMMQNDPQSCLANGTVQMALGLPHCMLAHKPD
jgi:hypothetical protein